MNNIKLVLKRFTLYIVMFLINKASNLKAKPKGATFNKRCARCTTGVPAKYVYCMPCKNHLYGSGKVPDSDAPSLTLELKYDVAIKALEKITNASPKECGLIASSCLNKLVV